MLNYIRDRFLRQRLAHDEKEIKVGFIITSSFVAFLLANVIYLNILVLNNNTQPPKEAATTTSTPPSPTSLQSVEPSRLPSLVPATPSQIVETELKDYYLNLGSGSNQSTDWTDVAGTSNTFDIASYKNISEVRLESNINVPTANGMVSIRLFNKTDNYAVWNSERTVQSQTKGDLLISQNIIYPQGYKLYQIQMKSQLGVLANLIQARIYIVAK